MLVVDRRTRPGSALIVHEINAGENEPHTDEAAREKHPSGGKGSSGKWLSLVLVDLEDVRFDRPFQQIAERL